MRLRIRAAVIVIALLAIGASTFFAPTAPAAEAESGGVVVGVKVQRPARLAEAGVAVDVLAKVRCQGALLLIIDTVVTQRVGGTVVTGYGLEYVDPCASGKVVVRSAIQTSPSPGFVPGRADVTAEVYIYDELNLIGRASDAASIRIRR
jgi:hypothetical protein